MRSRVWRVKYTYLNGDADFSDFYSAKDAEKFIASLPSSYQPEVVVINFFERGGFQL